MPTNPLARLATWRQVASIAVAVPLLVGLVLSAFAWPAARTAPRDLPVGLVTASTSGARGPSGADGAVRLEHAGFDVHPYVDAAGARRAIADRSIYGALVVTARGSTVLTASAAGPAVASLLTSALTAAAPAPVQVVDVVPLSSKDPRGSVLASAVLPLVFAGMIVAMLVAAMLGVRPTYRMLIALLVVSMSTGAAAYLVAQAWLGVLPGDHLWTWAALALTVLAIAATVAGLYELLGIRGTAAGSILMLFLGNPFSGITSAPELLPSGPGTLGRILPPGAGAELLRSTAYFHGHGGAGHVTVLVCWAVLGMVLVVVGHARQREPLTTTLTGAAIDAGRHEQHSGAVSVAQLTARA